LGELIPGSFVVPSNPIVPSSYIPHIGELLPASFPVPQNPLIAAITSPPGYGLPNQPGLGCGCAPGCGSGMCGGAQGMGALGSDCGCIGGMCGCGMGQFSDPASLLMMAGAALLLVWMMMPGGKGYRQERAKAETEYRSKVAGIKSRHKGYKRIARGTAGAVQRGLTAATA
jgi:hypothetical protein